VKILIFLLMFLSVGSALISLKYVADFFFRDVKFVDDALQWAIVAMLFVFALMATFAVTAQGAGA